MTSMSRRCWLQASVVGSVPCACMAKATNECCTIPELTADSVRIESNAITVDLARTPALSKIGSYVKVTDATRQLRILIARPAKDSFVALDQKCTHGGGALTYVHKHKHLYCTCWGHSRFALNGSVLFWPNKQVPRPIRAYRVQRAGNLLQIELDGAS